jgi:MGT family glycosyltransferase
MCVWGGLAQQILKLPATALASVFVPNPALVSMEEMVDQAYSQAPKEVILAGIGALNTYLKIAQRIDRRFGTRSPNMVEFFAGRQPLNILFTSRHFHPAGDRYDESYQFVGPSMASRIRAQGVPFTLPDGDHPLIYISLGTIFSDRPEFYRACFDAFGGGPYSVVVATGTRIDPQTLGSVPANFIVRDYVPQLEVLDRASLFLTHGGMNSASEALWHGVPLLVYPQHGDQHLVAARVSELGAGLRLSNGDIEPVRLRQLADRVLAEPAFRKQGRKIAEGFHAAGGCRRAAGEILAYSRNTAPGIAACPQFA